MSEQWLQGDISDKAIYQHPEDYDLEVAAHDIRDLPFGLNLLQQAEPRGVLEIGCGTTLMANDAIIHRHSSCTFIIRANSNCSFA